jgi:hypothetical protein
VLSPPCGGPAARPKSPTELSERFHGFR